MRVVDRDGRLREIGESQAIAEILQNTQATAQTNDALGRVMAEQRALRNQVAVLNRNITLVGVLGAVGTAIGAWFLGAKIGHVAGRVERVGERTRETLDAVREGTRSVELHIRAADARTTDLLTRVYTPPTPSRHVHTSPAQLPH